MNNDSFVFHVNFPVQDVKWRVQCSVTLLSENVPVDTVRILDAMYNGIRLDERSWKELLRQHGLISEFCSEMMDYVSLLLWSLSGPVAEA